MLKSLFISATCILVFFNAEGQSTYNNNWYFGRNAALDFNSNPPTVKTDNKMQATGTSSSVSDPLTGQLLFYTNGNSFWNRFGEMIDSSVQGPTAPDVLIIPLENFKNRFIVFNLSKYFIVDMEANSGKGIILKNENFPLASTINRITSVKHCLSKSFWLISIRNKNFNAYLVHPNGQIDPPVVSPNTTLESMSYLGDFVSSNDGQKLAVTSYQAVNSTYLRPQVFNFDKRCGTVAEGCEYLPIEAEWNRPHGIAFSPNDAFIYVAFGYLESQLVQYPLNDVNSYYLAASSPENFNQIGCGPDGKLYITTHINQIPSGKLDVVHNPNQKGAACNYQENFIQLTGIAYFELPNLIANYTGSCSSNSGFQWAVESTACINQKLTFILRGSKTGIDSLHWYFGDPNFPNKRTNGFEVNHSYAKAGNYKAYAVMQFCNKRDTFFFPIQIETPLPFSLGKDTTLCFADSIRIGYAFPNASYRWNTGDNSAYLKVKQAGEYILNLNNKGCVSADSILVLYYPSIKTMLEDAYYICEEEKELIELDAGKGFKSYLWYPTSDTTQWIEVNKRGNYYVIVNDYRGCKGKGESEVESRCDLRVYIPNAFTPNDDGLNDVFQIHTDHEVQVDVQVFNRWGQMVYSGEASSSWDGTFKGSKVMSGVYLVKVHVRGFVNKLEVKKSYSTTLHILY